MPLSRPAGCGGLARWQRFSERRHHGVRARDTRSTNRRPFSNASRWSWAAALIQNLVAALERYQVKQFDELALDRLLPLIADLTDAAMQFAFIDEIKEIALAGRWSLEPIRGIELNIRGRPRTSQSETSAAVHLRMIRTPQPVVAAQDDKPVILPIPIGRAFQISHWRIIAPKPALFSPWPSQAPIAPDPDRDRPPQNSQPDDPLRPPAIAPSRSLLLPPSARCTAAIR